MSQFYGKPSLCLWGDQQTAIEGRDPDEQVCLVRVEILEVLDEPAPPATE